MEAAERELVLEQLRASHQRLLNAVHGLSAEQWTFRPAEDCWSVADCVEHIIVLERMVFNFVQKNLDGPEPAERPALLEKDEKVLRLVPSRTRRVKGPPEVMPAGRWPQTDQLIREFNLTRDHSIGFATETTADLRSRCFPHPFLGDLDCYQWLLFMGTHCERHVRQLEEVKADPGFPRNAGAGD